MTLRMTCQYLTNEEVSEVTHLPSLDGMILRGPLRGVSEVTHLPSLDGMILWGPLRGVVLACAVRYPYCGVKNLVLEAIMNNFMVNKEYLEDKNFGNIPLILSMVCSSLVSC